MMSTDIRRLITNVDSLAATLELIVPYIPLENEQIPNLKETVNLTIHEVREDLLSLSQKSTVANINTTKVHVSTTPPTALDGVAGDIWLQVDNKVAVVTLPEEPLKPQPDWPFPITSEIPTEDTTDDQ